MKTLAFGMMLALTSSLFAFRHEEVVKRIESIYITTNINDDFNKVKQNGEEIIRLADQIERPDLMLLGLHLLCWSAEYHKEIDELLRYVQMGNRIMSEQAENLSILDTGAVMRASIIHATGQYFYSLGNYQKTIEEFSKIIPPNGQPMTSDSGLVSAACSYMGQSFINMGNLDKGVQYFELANRYSNDDDDYYNALHHMYLAQYYHSIGKTNEAINRLDLALPLISYSKKSIYLQYAGYYRHLAKYDSAIYYVRKSISLYTKNDPYYIEGYRLLGDIYYKSNKPDSAQFYYENSLKSSDNIYTGSHHSKARPLNGIANILRDKGKFNQAYDNYIKSLSNIMAGDRPFNPDYLREIILPREGMMILLDLADLYFRWFQSDGRMGLLDSCITVLENALFLNDICRREQFNYESKESRALIQADITDLGIKASATAYEKSQNPGYAQKIFYFMEKNKGNILLDRIFEMRALSISGIPDSLLEKEDKLKKEVSLYRDRLLPGSKEDSNRAAIKRKYDDKQMEYINLISGIEKNYNKYYMLKYKSESPTAEEVRKLIPASDQMILQYYVGADKIYMAAITRKEIIIRSATLNDELKKNITGLLSQINSKEITEMENDINTFLDFVKFSRYLYIKLLEPVLSVTPRSIKKITVIPDGFLCYVPFEILLTKDPVEKLSGYSQLPYLIKNRRITYDHSASLIFTSNQTKEKHALKYLGFAPEYENPVTPSDPEKPKISLSHLSANLDEIESCRKIWKGISYTGNHATETQFTNSAPNYNIIHLAVHTVLNDEDPQISGLVFSGEDEGMLYIHELYNLDMNAQLVILSACETGIGRMRRGEGMISLARAFRYAGCRNILMSLWKVNDRSTKEMMVLFNRNLSRGMPKDKALQQAKLKYLQGNRNLHPAFWASMIIIGDHKPVRSGPGYKSILAASVILISILLFYLRKLRTFPTHSNDSSNYRTPNNEY